MDSDGDEMSEGHAGSDRANESVWRDQCEPGEGQNKDATRV